MGSVIRPIMWKAKAKEGPITNIYKSTMVMMRVAVIVNFVVRVHLPFETDWMSEWDEIGCANRKTNTNKP